MKHHSSLLAPVASVLMLTLAACSSGSGGSAYGAGPAPATVDTPRQATPTALNFDAPLVGGGTFHGADLAGAPVAFWFWAPT